MPLQVLFQNFIISNGRSDINLIVITSQIILQTALTLALAPLGIKAMVTGFSALNLLFTFCWYFALLRIHHLSFLSILKDTVPFAAVATAVMAVTYFTTCRVETLWLLLILRVVVATLLYLAVMKLLHAKTLEDIIAFFFHRKSQ